MVLTFKTILFYILENNGGNLDMTAGSGHPYPFPSQCALHHCIVVVNHNNRPISSVSFFNFFGATITVAHSSLRILFYANLYLWPFSTT